MILFHPDTNAYALHYHISWTSSYGSRGAPKICSPPLISLSLSVSLAFTIPKREGVERFGEGGLTDGARRGGWGTGKGDSGLSSRAVAGNTDT